MNDWEELWEVQGTDDISEPCLLYTFSLIKFRPEEEVLQKWYTLVAITKADPEIMERNRNSGNMEKGIMRWYLGHDHGVRERVEKEWGHLSKLMTVEEGARIGTSSEGNLKKSHRPEDPWQWAERNNARIV